MAERIIKTLRDMGAKHIHLDLDMLDSDEFPHTPLPADGGISYGTLSRILPVLQKDFILTGFGIFEYKPCGSKKPIF